MKKYIFLAAILTACATPGPSVRVVEQSDKKPSWASLTKTTYQDDGQMNFIGYFTSDGDSRASAVINGSSGKATAMPLEAITDDFLRQAGVGEDLHDASSKLVISTLQKSPPNIPGLHIVGSYYERVEIVGSNGETRTEVRAFSLAQCSVSEFNDAKREALRRLKGDSKITQELNVVMSEQHDRAYGDKKPASTNDKPTEDAQ